MFTRVLCLALFAGSAAADCGRPDSICADESPWARASAASVRAQPSDTTDYYAWDYTFAGGDVFVDVDHHENDRIIQGEILVVGGRAMLTRGIDLLAGNETEPLETALTSFQIVAALLGRAVPEGPDGVGSKRDVDVAEERLSVYYRSLGLAGWIPPPWKLRGVVEKIGDRTFEYSLTLAYADGGGPLTARFSGVWDGTSLARSLDDGMSVTGWAFHALGQSTPKPDGGAIYAPPPQAHRPRAQTLGALREAMAQAAAASRDSAGGQR